MTPAVAKGSLLTAAVTANPCCMRPTLIATKKRPPLMDTFDRTHTYLRVSITDRCNLRCTYCMPAEGVQVNPREHILSFEEIHRLVRIFAACGVNKVRLTGGEPLVRKNLEDLVASISATSGIEAVALTTNGVLLAPRARDLKKAGITHLNMSLDTLRADRFEKIALRARLTEVLEGITAALDADFIPLKLNVVVIGGTNDDEILDFVEFVRHRPINVRFIEYMPFDQNGWNQKEFVPYAQMLDLIRARFPLVPPAQPQHRSDVARDYQIEGFAGSVSFITSMTQDFCGDCNRIRLTADGAIKSCLFSNAELSLRDAMRQGSSDGDLEELIRLAITKKHAGHAPMEELVKLPNRSMIQIGG